MAQKKKSTVKAKAPKAAAAVKKSGPVTAHAAAAPKASAKAAAKAVPAAKAKAPAAKPAAAAKPASATKSAPAKTASVKSAAVKSVPAAKPPVAAAKAAAAPVAKKATVAAPASARVQPPKAAVKAAAAFAAHRAQSTTVPARAVAASVPKATGSRITAPARAAEIPATPKVIAEKASAARKMIAVQKKPVNQRHGFKTNEFIVYPAHGVGRIIGIEEQEIAGMSLELFVINFEKEKLTLRVPTGKLESVGMRKLADDDIVKKAMEILKGRARIKRTMWSRRAQEYVAKINSGDLVSIAEVVRDLYRSEAQPEQSYSERQLYEDALDRMAREIAAVEKLDDRGAVQRITDVLSKSARGRRLAEEGESEEVQAA